MAIDNIEKSEKKRARIDFAKFFRETKAEFKKIVWPSKRTITNNTIIVLAAVILIGIIVAGFDFVLIHGLKALLNLFGK